MRYKVATLVLVIVVIAGAMWWTSLRSRSTESVPETNGQSRSMDIESYVRNSISELSPIKEQVGGKFYVTYIETSEGVGIVSYEDGHNAYVADFRYEINESGKPSVSSFTVRK